MPRYDNDDNKAQHSQRKQLIVLSVLTVVGCCFWIPSMFSSPKRAAAVSSNAPRNVEESAVFDERSSNRQEITMHRPASLSRNLFAFDADAYERKVVPTETKPVLEHAISDPTSLVDADRVRKELKLEAVLLNNGRRALINGELFRVGDRINNKYTVMKIEQRHVTVELHNVIVELEL